MRERQYEKLIVWKEAHKLCLLIYACTKEYPSEEKFGLISQMRRSSYSIPTNIVEGNARRSHPEKIHFLNIAIGSLEELHYQSLLSKDLGYLSEKKHQALCQDMNRVGFLLHKLRTSFT